MRPRHEIHTTKSVSDVKPGRDFHFECGIGRTLARSGIWDAGFASYAQWQVTDDGYTTLMLSTVLYDETIHDECYAVEPEGGALYPGSKLFFRCERVWEFGSKDRSRGKTTTHTLTKIL